MFVARWIIITVLALACAVSQPVSGLAQSSLLGTSSSSSSDDVKLPDPLTPETIRELVAKLSDAQVRELLLHRLDAVAKQDATQSAEQSTVDFLTNAFEGIGHNFEKAVEGVPGIPSGLHTGFQSFTGDGGFSALFMFIGKLGLMIVAGLAAEFVVTRLTRPWLQAVENKSDADNLVGSIKILLLRAMLEALGLVAYAVVSLALIGPLFQMRHEADIAHLFNVIVVILIKIFILFGRLTMAPQRPDLRRVTLEDHLAKKGYWMLVAGGALIGIQGFIVESLRLNQVPMDELRIGYWLNVGLYAFVLIGIYTWREGITQMIVGVDRAKNPRESRFARFWPYVSMALVVCNWMLIQIIADMGRFDLLRGQQHVTLLLIIMAPTLDSGLRGIVRHMSPPIIGEGAVAEAAHRATLEAYVRIGRVLMVCFGVLFAASIWSLDLVDVANTGVGEQLATNVIDALMALFIGYIIWEIVNLWINRRLAREATEAGIDLNSEEPGGGEGGGTGLSRLATVLPVMRLVITAGIAVMAVLIALSELGVDTTPLLAGAGIVGLAIGFGAQTLVRDVVSGLFFLIDDAFRVGEYLVIDNTVGTVEKISLRSLQLRHHQGPIHTIPYGEIPKVTNNSRDWVITKMKFTVPFATDVNKVKKIFKKIGAEMLEAEYAEDLIQTFKSQGVYDVDDVGIIIRGKFMTRPGKQWIVRKDVYSRVQKAFAENGIEFARKEVRVNLGDEPPAHLTEEQKQQIGAAVADAAEPPPAAAGGQKAG